MEALYILGDLCDVWLGDDDDAPFAEELRQCLRQLSSRVPVFLMHGNRDFLFGRTFQHQTGISLIPDPYPIHVAGTHFLLCHGDALCTDDLDYMSARNILRSEDWQTGFLSQPIRERRRLASSMRDQSETAKARLNMDLMDVNQSEVMKLMQRHDTLNLVHGHTHRPGIHQFSNAGRDCRRYVLGDWNRCGWALSLSGQTEQLICFSLNGL